MSVLDRMKRRFSMIRISNEQKGKKRPWIYGQKAPDLGTLKNDASEICNKKEFMKNKSEEGNSL